MNDFTHILERAQEGDSKAAEELLPLVYEELRRLAAYKLAGESAEHTLQPTALVHEAWLRLAGNESARFESRARFFNAAAEAMRRILVDRARQRNALKRGGAAVHEALSESRLPSQSAADELLAVHEVLDQLAVQDPSAAELVKLRYFAGLTMTEAAEVLGVPLRTAERLWSYARAWLRREMAK